MKHIIILLIIIMAAIIIAQEKPTIKIIVNSKNDIESISAKDISKIFMKKTTKWENGTIILPVDQIETSQVRKDFSEQLLNKSISAVKAYWQEQIFSGRGVPPPEKASDREVIDYVKANAGAIGYIAENTSISPDGVKIIEIKD